jgi:preprotein translocase SecE subunit
MAESESKSVKASGRSVLGDSTAYLSDSVAELKRVAFPTRAETMQATVATLFIIAFVSVCLFVLDVVFDRAMAAILG